jgi:hypothetical protein
MRTPHDVEVLDSAKAERIAEAFRNGAGQIVMLEPGQHQPLTEPRPEAMADRRQGGSICRISGMTESVLFEILSVLVTHEEKPLACRIAALEAALTVARGDERAEEDFAARAEQPPVLEDVIDDAIAHGDWPCIERNLEAMVKLPGERRKPLRDRCAAAMGERFPFDLWSGLLGRRLRAETAHA